MIVPHDRIVVGVSGGADSVCLLFLLLAYARKVPLDMIVVHVNHGIRSDSGEDARYVEELCGQEGVPCRVVSVDIRKQAAEEKCSEEDAGRRARYRAFRQAAEETGSRKIAVAHNSDDNAETMLFHLFRGSGIKGLCGIAPVREEAVSLPGIRQADVGKASTGQADVGKADMGQEGTGQVSIIRPILCLRRQEVETYLQNCQIAWRTDSTNNGDNYARNRIRHHMLPFAEQEIAAGAVGHMCRTAELLRETESFLEQETEGALGKCLVSMEEDTVWQERQGCLCYRLSVEAFRRFHLVLQKRMLYVLAKRISPTGKDISLVHITDMLALFTGEGNRRIDLPFGITARRQYGEVVLERREAAVDKGLSGQFWGGQPVMVPDMAETGKEDFSFLYRLGDLGEIEFKVFLIEKGQKVPKNQYTKWFDYDKIEESLVIRFRCTGDFFTIRDGEGALKHQSLKAYMITEKIPRQLRDAIPVVAAGNHILWLIGGRISEYFKVDGNTERILQVKLERSRCGGETEEENVGTHYGTFVRGGS